MSSHSLRYFMGIDGLIAIAFGLLVIILPTDTAAVAAAIVGIMMVGSGLFKIVHAIKNTALTGWNKTGASLLGFIYILAGLIIFINMRVASVSLFAVVGLMVGIAWLFEGVIQLSIVSRLEDHQAWLTFSAVLHIVAGILLMVSPIFGGAIIWMWLGITLIILGVYRLLMFFRF
ncbi:HdeD family acid-resistance protein [Fructobacillus evanidus]|uniref:DUF308 family (HdeD) n=1 Tax=Fructobacillus evanidus TaxID=3064281 RepID=A0ABM9MR51_9LACO|nr:Acid resistance membrane protein HdeD [Fructobacillus sp. LMG 32999]CAK1230463.1 Acid resistance membrane protein HdeD [Fructobacillus sp. LMG 32999]CAK1234208.1 Acid resistance membrane protein HdeD [Fructobacillus sp. LMG 32999]CAK1236368.1 Acid resistance membrane protein HdeD [Fructobacillus sp. LMG 32999]CAK1238212.1 Acid resistance membrane protein HdeD [Fructobacillus sp. LMG 32999]